MGRFKRSKKESRKLKMVIVGLPVWMDFEAWKFEKKWMNLQMNGGTKTVNAK